MRRTHLSDKDAGDIEAQSVAGRIAVFKTAHRALSELREFSIGKALSGVINREAKVVAMWTACEQDTPAVGVFDGIADQVRKNAHQHRGVACDNGVRVNPGRQFDPFGSCILVEHVSCVFEYLCEIVAARARRTENRNHRDSAQKERNWRGRARSEG